MNQIVREPVVADVLVVDGGNAALCATLTAREAGASVLLLEAAPREWCDDNPQRTHNLRCMHDASQDALIDGYPEEEYWQNLLRVTEGNTNEVLARLVIRTSSQCRGQMCQHGVNFQPPLSDALHVARTNASFMDDDKALVSAYYRSAEQTGVQIRYNTPVQTLELHNGKFVIVLTGEEQIVTKSCILAAGGFEPSREWLREAWGQNDRDEQPADNLLIRGTRFNQGVLLRFMIDAGADIIGNPSQSHCVTIDARASFYGGGICTHVGCVSLGIVVNCDADRFCDEGEDFWPGHYAIWGRLIARQPGQIGYSIIDSKAIGHSIPPVFPDAQADTLPGLTRQLDLDSEHFTRATVDYNAAYTPGQFDHTRSDNYTTASLAPPKTHWTRPIGTPPCYGYALRSGITFAYPGLYVNDTTAVHFAGKPSRNLFVAGEMMADNVLDKGYTAGVGMSVGTIFSYIVGQQTTRVAQREKHHEVV